MALKPNEKFFIKSWSARTNEDSYEQGVFGGGTSWDDTWNGFVKYGPFDSVADALKAVCEANGFSWNRDWWQSWYAETGEDPGRFDGQYMVDAENSEATENQLESWKHKKTRLWCCDLTVYLEVRPVIRSRDLYPDEVAILD